MGFKDKDEFLDSLFEHMFPEADGDVSDEDEAWFNEKVSKFFDQFDTGGNATNPPRRRRTANSGGNSGGNSTTSRRRSRSSSTSDSGYGSRTFFG